MPLDDDFSKTLLHFNGDDASTTFTDESGKTWTPRGNAQIDTAQYKFGGASGLFGGTNSSIDAPVTALDLYFGIGDFTIDFWANIHTITTDKVACFYEDFTDTANFIQFYNYNYPEGTHNWIFRIKSGGTTLVSIAYVDNITYDTWHHYAIVRNGTNFSVYRDGTSKGTGTLTGAVVDTSFLISIAKWSNAGAAQYFNGWIDEYRISKGIARWTSNFTPPTKAYGTRSGVTGVFLSDYGVM